MNRYQRPMVNQRVVKRRSVGVFGSTAATHIQPLDDGGGYYLKRIGKTYRTLRDAYLHHAGSQPIARRTANSLAILSNEVVAVEPPFNLDDSPAGECLIWRGGLHEDGYGIITADGAQRRAHRVAYESAGGVIQDGQTLNHLCHRPFCVQPAHLYAGDHASNTRDRQIRKQTQLAHPRERLVLPGGWDELTERNERVWQSAVLYREPENPETVPLPGLGIHEHHFTIPVGAAQDQLMYACEVCGASSDDRWRALEEYLANRQHCEICQVKLNRSEVDALMERRKEEALEGLPRQPQRNQEYHEGNFDRLMNVRDLLHFSFRPGRRPLPSATRLAIVRSCFAWLKQNDGWIRANHRVGERFSSAGLFTWHYHVAPATYVPESYVNRQGTSIGREREVVWNLPNPQFLLLDY